MKRMDGAVVIVTGASSGIGRSVAEAWLERGATVYLSSHDGSRLEAIWHELREKFRQVEHEVCDVRSEQAVERLVSRVLAASGHIDVLVNNAGYATYQAFEETSTPDILDLLDVNLGGAMRCTRAVLPSMIHRRSGSIVNVASIGGEIIITPNAVYCGAKHGMVAWSQAIRYELLSLRHRSERRLPWLHADVFPRPPDLQATGELAVDHAERHDAAARGRWGAARCQNRPADRLRALVAPVPGLAHASRAIAHSGPLGPSRAQPRRVALSRNPG